MSGRPVPARPQASQVQPFQLVEPVNPLMIVWPAFPAQQGKDPPHAVTYPGMGNIADTGP